LQLGETRKNRVNSRAEAITRPDGKSTALLVIGKISSPISGFGMNPAFPAGNRKRGGLNMRKELEARALRLQKPNGLV